TPPSGMGCSRRIGCRREATRGIEALPPRSPAPARLPEPGPRLRTAAGPRRARRVVARAAAADAGRAATLHAHDDRAARVAGTPRGVAAAGRAGRARGDRRA